MIPPTPWPSSRTSPSPTTPASTPAPPGSSLELTGTDTTGDVTLTNNLYAAPNLHNGVDTSSAVYVHAGDLRAFGLIDGNIWPIASGFNGAAPGAVTYIAGSAFPTGYLNADQWNAMAQVRTDLFEDISVIGTNYQATANGVTAGASGKIAA